MKIERITNSLKDTLKIKKNENVLIVYDKSSLNLSKYFFKASKNLTSEVSLLEIKITGRHGKEPLKSEFKKMQGFDYLIILTTYSLTHTDAIRYLYKKGSIVASMPGFKMSMLNALTTDYKKMQSKSRKLCNLLKRAKKNNSTIYITTKNGTNLEVKILKEIYLDDGNVKKNGISNLPSGEVFFAPKLGEGLIVFDRYEKEITKPTLLLISENNIVGYQKSKEGRKLKKLLSVKDGEFLAEIGIGTNPSAKIIGNTLLDEKVKGTLHIAFGNNVSMGGKNNAKVHIDVILYKPTIKIGKKIIMKEGKELW